MGFFVEVQGLTGVSVDYIRDVLRIRDSDIPDDKALKMIKRAAETLDPEPRHRFFVWAYSAEQFEERKTDVYEKSEIQVKADFEV